MLSGTEHVMTSSLRFSGNLRLPTSAVIPAEHQLDLSLIFARCMPVKLKPVASCSQFTIIDDVALTLHTALTCILGTEP